jgi:hypothetical protein
MFNNTFNKLIPDVNISRISNYEAKPLMNFLKESGYLQCEIAESGVITDAII